MRVLFAVLTTCLIALLSSLPAQATPVETPSCGLTSEGIYNGLWVKHRIYVNEDVVFGANDMDSILSQLENLRGQGLCR
ncbi:hypothetical protein [Bdellovibrio reynosensis]|uniref:Uncharacterized protein n=1 Tax=Bdellovibrio reynosensis TaxID=2835041 RepID=A0ABY4C4N9_9BACT|nr:hypothetical protein [Bdellovibrio reynosensis]UOE99793.1 hypothetical protein MNR06_08800 [Bdellovibrio reynosensis]